MLKVAPIRKVLFAEGSSLGIPCILVDCQEKSGGTERDLNGIFEEIFKLSNLRTVIVKGFLSKQSEIKTLIEGLVSKGKYVLFMTDSSENIGPVRALPRIKIVLIATPPDEKVNNINAQSLTYLKDDDEIQVLITDLDSYNRAKKYFKDKLISRPTILFSLRGTDEKGLLEVLEQYLIDSETLSFKNRLTKPLSF